MLVPIIVVFAGYTVTSYGWVLIRGFNITFRQWISPLNPYIWTGSDPPPIPPVVIFPGQNAVLGVGGAALNPPILGGSGSGGTAGSAGSGGGVGSGESGVSPISGLGSITLPGVTANPNVGSLFPVVQPYSPPTVRVGQSSQRESL